MRFGEPFLWLLLAIAGVITLATMRIMYLLPALRPRKLYHRSRTQNPGYILIVLGSGGHTTEMFMLLKDLNTTSYSHRRYVMSEGDSHSITKMKGFESELEHQANAAGFNYGSYDFKIVPRARNIHQSLLSTPRSAMATFIACLKVFARSSSQQSHPIYPDLVIANGPANAFILICAAFILRYLGLTGTAKTLRCVYVESWARVRRLSLTGRLLRMTGLCDRFLVQWPALESHSSRRKQLGEFHGPLVI